MQEYRDGTYGEIKDRADLLKELADDPTEMGRTKSVHFGSVEELEAQKLSGGNAKRIMAKLEQLERKLNRLLIHVGADDPGEILVVDK